MCLCIAEGELKTATAKEGKIIKGFDKVWFLVGVKANLILWEESCPCYPIHYHLGPFCSAIVINFLQRCVLCRLCE